MKIVYTVWAFLLNLFGVSVFKSCFVDATEDEYDDNLLSGPPITSLIFTTGVYIIISNLGFYPKTFRKPPSFVMFIYEVSLSHKNHFTTNNPLYLEKSILNFHYSTYNMNNNLLKLRKTIITF